MKKMIKMARAIKKALRVFSVAALILIGVAIVVTAILYFARDIIPAGVLSIKLGNYNMVLSEQATSMQMFISWAVLMPSAIIKLIFFRYIAKLLCDVLEPLSEGRMFDKGIGMILTKMWHAILCFGAIVVVLEEIAIFALDYYLDLSSIFDTDVVSNVELSVVIDCSFLVWAAIVYLLSFVFKVGEKLQQLEDETI